MYQNAPARKLGPTLTNLLLIVTLLLSGLSWGVPALADGGENALRAHEALLSLAAAQPQAPIGIIVQKVTGAEGLEALVERLGGDVTLDLSIINAFAATVPGRVVPQIAQADGVRWVSLDAAIVKAAKPIQPIVTQNLLSAYVRTIGADRLWNGSPRLQGQGIGVAVVDSGVSAHADIASRIVAACEFDPRTNLTTDSFGHGTHVAGIIGGDGTKSRGAYIGVAPKVNLINVKVCDVRGAGTTSAVVAGLQWISENRARYNIRVANLSLSSAVAESYHTSPLDAAVEVLWFQGIVVVVSSGNNGSGAIYPPANDPFVITVGAADDLGTPNPMDDVLADYSAYGVTAEGVAKPELVAPGSNIVSLLANAGCQLARAHPTHRVNGFPNGRDYYFRISGTSMASAVVAGAVALLLQDEPRLTPDQVKYRLMATARPFDTAERAGAGYLDLYTAIRGTTTEYANQGTPISGILSGDSEAVTWDALNWGALNWGALNWGALNWGALNWGATSWQSDHWDH